MINLKNTLITALGLAVISTSCKKEEEAKGPETNDPGYAVALKAVAGGDYNYGATDYLLDVPSLTEGKISSTGRGIEQLGFQTYQATENSVISVGYVQSTQAKKYVYDGNGFLTEDDSFVFESTIDLVGQTEVEGQAIAVTVPRTGLVNRTFHNVNYESMEISEAASHIIYQLGTEIAFPTAIVVRDDKVFVPFYMLNSSFSTPHTDTAYVAIYSYPEMEFEGIEKDTRMGPMGLYGSGNGMIKLDNGDIYGYSCAAAACGFTTQDKNSGFLRINNGETTFDGSYHYDFEGVSSKKINWIGYLGGTKVIARVFEDVTSPAWAAFPNANPAQSIMNLVIIDVEAKTYTEVSGVPDHIGQFNAPLYIEDGKAYMSVSTTIDSESSSDQSAIYVIDLETAKATKGATLEGFELGLISKIHDKEE